MGRPQILYGTAWKEAKTRALTKQALDAGFTGIDTANQRKHYFEEAVGLGLQDFLTETGKKRADIFLQTKFTYIRGQDHRLPYDPKESLSTQVKQSFDSSLNHLQTNFIDSYVLHGPSHHLGITDDDSEVWQAMEELVNKKQVGALGVSNVNLQQLESLFAQAKVKPSYLQNRCFAVTEWDREIRDFCSKNKVIYQGFSLLTANLDYLRSGSILQMAEAHKATVPQIVFAFALQRGMLPLTGTTSAEHMKEDLGSEHFKLSEAELDSIETIAN